jgi:hypothetical protein
LTAAFCAKGCDSLLCGRSISWLANFVNPAVLQESSFLVVGC